MSSPRSNPPDLLSKSCFTSILKYSSEVIYSGRKQNRCKICFIAVETWNMVDKICVVIASCMVNGCCFNVYINKLFSDAFFVSVFHHRHRFNKPYIWYGFAETLNCKFQTILSRQNVTRLWPVYVLRTSEKGRPWFLPEPPPLRKSNSNYTRPHFSLPVKTSQTTRDGASVYF